MICCLNSACHNPSSTDDTKFCINCGVPLVILRNRYRPVKFLGGGGFGKTYLAEDIDKLNEKCVIKQFAPQAQGTAALQKATELFKQEARRLQQLGEHPQIPSLLAYFEEDSRLYLVQQFVDGQNLFEKLQQKLLSQETFSEILIRDLLEDLLNILKIVHGYGVIHRDIKPENIIQRGDGKVVLIDFGASKLLTKTAMTARGTTIGSFGYASLEQMQGGEAYPASDLYGLGATCFHLLSGIHPWELWRSQGYGWVRNWQQHLKQPVTPKLSNIIDKLLQEDYQQRYQSTDEVYQDLHQLSQPIPTPAVAPTQLPKNKSDSKIPQKLFLKAIPLLIFVGAGTIYLQGLGNNAEAEKIISIESPSPSIQQEQKTAESFYNQGIEKYNNKNFLGAIEDYSQAIKINPNYVDAYNNRGLASYKLGDSEGAIEDYNQAIKINPNYALAYYNLGVVRNDLGNFSAAIEDYNQAIKINPNYANAYYNRGLARYTLGNKLAAIEDFDRAITIDSSYADAYYNRGLARYDLGDNQAAIEDYNQAIKINPIYVSAYNNRGLARYQLGDKVAAIKDFNRAININPNHANAYFNLGLAHSDLGNRQAGIENYRKAANLYKQQGKETSYQNALNRISKL